jgi:hypothetical protein
MHRSQKSIMAMSLEEALQAALDDEYRARATYRAVLDAFGDVRPFINSDHPSVQETFRRQ